MTAATACAIASALLQSLPEELFRKHRKRLARIVEDTRLQHERQKVGPMRKMYLLDLAEIVKRESAGGASECITS